MSKALEFTEESVRLLHESMCHALRFGAMLEDFHNMVRRCLKHRAWEKRHCRRFGRPFKSALEYFTHNEPDGVGTTRETVERLIAGTPTEDMWRKEVTPGRGGDRRSEEYYRINSDNVTIDQDAPTDRGNRRAYTMQRLREERPDLAARVDAGEVVNGRRYTANAAAIEAGFRRKPTAFEQVAKLVPKLTAAERRRLMEMLAADMPVQAAEGEVVLL